MRLDKFLADCGLGTRKEIKKLIKDGMIKVNSSVNLRPETKIDENIDKVYFGDEELIYKKFVYLVLNKPQDFVSATQDTKFDTVIDLVPDEYLHYDLFPVGRLDIDTEGLLVITNDGALSHKLLSPKKHVPKTYYAEVLGVVDDADISAFENGVVLDDGYKTNPAELKILNISDNMSEIELTITEGKFHQVKRMFESVGKKVVYLKRIKMNELMLDDKIKLGEMRELTEEEFNLLCKDIK